MKKEIPLHVLKKLKEIHHNYKNKVKLSKPDDILLSMSENSDNPQFYFKIKSHRIQDHTEVIFDIDVKPISRLHLNNAAYGVFSNNLYQEIDNWLALLEEYEEPNPFFDESIEDYYYKEISKTINIQDSDAEYAPYSFESQKQLYRYTEKIIEVIESAKNEENSDEVEEIVEETKFLQETLSKSTKKQVFERLKKIWAKTWKFSYEIFKEIIVNLAAEYIKGILNGNTFLL